MAQPEILIWPDPRLKEHSTRIERFDESLRQLVQDMLETMYSNDGIGLAAPQIGVPKRVLVIDIFAGQDEPPKDAAALVVINPEFIEKSGSILWDEGCLSVPGETGDVERARHVKVHFQDLKGQEMEIEADELLAVALQHENDHLDGILFVDHLSRLKRDVIRRRMIKLKNEKDQAVAS